MHQRTFPTELKKKKYPTEWETIFANYISDKGIMFRIYLKLL